MTKEPKSADSVDFADVKQTVSALSDHINWMHGTLQQILTRGIPASQTDPVHAFVNPYLNQNPEQLYEAVVGTTRVLRDKPSHIGMRSCLCQQAHFALDEYRYWFKHLNEPLRLHRKDWEYFYILQTLWENGLLEPGKRGLGFAVGHEPIPAVLAKFGCEIVATDQAHENALKFGWAQSGQHASELTELERPHICDRDTFYKHVSFKAVDMNDIPADLGNFDFCWSICSFEHLGSLDHGMRFVENSLKTLKPGGIAIHTTEYNLTSNNDTIESENLSIYRQRDIVELAERLAANGHVVMPLDLEPSKGFIENLIDLPPFRLFPHLRLKIEQYNCTSVGLIVKKRGDA